MTVHSLMTKWALTALKLAKDNNFILRGVKNQESGKVLVIFRKQQNETTNRRASFFPPLI